MPWRDGGGGAAAANGDGGGRMGKHKYLAGLFEEGGQHFNVR